MRDRKMCVTEKAFQILVCPSTRLRMHQQPLNTALSDPGDAYVDGEFGDIWCWFMYTWRFTYSATQCSIFGHKMVTQNINAKEKAKFHVICGSEGYRIEA